MPIDKLKNPAWYALNESQKDLAIDYDGVQFYHPDYCPFGGFIDLKKSQNAIDQYAEICNDFFVIGEKPEFSSQLTLKNELICIQMVLESPISIDTHYPIIELKNDQQKEDLFELVNLVQPGYFKIKTSELGDYYGIYQDNQLIAASGERMKMNGLTEVSAIVTHPEHTRKGYAKQLTTHTTHKIFERNEIPFLHVTEDNFGAIQLYEKLGFKTVGKISFWHFVKL